MIWDEMETFLAGELAARAFGLAKQIPRGMILPIARSRVATPNRLFWIIENFRY